MDYKKKLEEAKRLYETANTDQRYVLESLFPELKESEDEQIRNEIIYFIGARNDISLDTHNRWLSWLEKQGSNVDNANKEYWRGYHEGKQVILDKYAELEKPNEQKSTNNQFTPEQANILDKHIDKILEQKPFDKVEPKFHEGDWISGYYTNYKVMAINNEGYAVEDTEGNKINILFENEKFHHLFTITDAKDGDVLVSRSPFIYGKQCPYGGLNWCNNKFIKASNFIFTDSPVHPATKEQRDLLFQKMHEAGYEWDAEKKELKKIEQKPTGKVENKSDFELSLKHIMEEAIECGDTHNLKADAELLYNIAQKPAKWSEEDEKIYSRIYDLIHAAAYANYEVDEDGREFGEYAKMTNWLKSLKPQKQ